ncbi:short-subunit dehydrogenase [Roseibium hamelinense]|uniref:Short-subunit dehydrogenase n=1 Tax=Roseibium hamelinense TaxID=150831 RepID=A0A562TAA5_9HYPH|nr:SDR family oxidoreductase [Roseibium hamelinense]MTI45357.1 SDR family oxidoreductase [Roseibium hamelinense]TWI90273.1 short-subunit dehydrogenase [Roseibium hamelinense]
MRVTGRKYAITGAGRGLGAALAIVMADAGSHLVLLGRSEAALGETAAIIRDRTGRGVDTLLCDLADRESSAAAGARLAAGHPDLDGLIHNGAMWLDERLDDVSDAGIEACIASAAIGALILTRHVLPGLKARPDADIHTVVSTSGLQNRRQPGGGTPFRAAKSAQAGMVQGLADELAETRIRVTSVFPSYIDDISPADPAWSVPPGSRHALSNREVVEAILFILNLPPNVAVPTLVIE